MMYAGRKSYWFLFSVAATVILYMMYINIHRTATTCDYLREPVINSKGASIPGGNVETMSGSVGRINILNADYVDKLGNIRCAALKTAGGKPICYDTKDRFIGRALEITGIWEPKVWDALLKILQEDPGLGLIDVGANIGVFTISAAALGRRVVAVEAFYENIQRLSTGLRMGGLTDNVTLVHNAVSDIYENIFFWRPVDNPGGVHTISKGVTLAPNKPVFVGGHDKINTIHLNDLRLIIPFQKAVMKIDIEGYENKAFKKVELLLQSVDIRALFMEWTFVTRSEDCLDILNKMRAKNYEAYSLTLQPLSGNTLADVRKWPHDIVWLKKKA